MGYIKLFRTLLDHPLCYQLPAGWFRVWVVALLMTNFRPAKWWSGSREVTIPAGSFVTSLPRLAEKSGVSVKILRKALSYFERSDMLTTMGAYSGRNGFRHLSITNWETYQSPDEEVDATEGQVSENGEGQKKGRLRAGIGQVEGTNLRSILEEPTLFPLGESQLQEPGRADFSDNGKHLDLRKQQKVWFADWWSKYWLKKARLAAEKAFYVYVKTYEKFQIVMKARDDQMAEMMAKEPCGRPHGATWLNGERWNDEVVSAVAPVQRPLTFGEIKEQRQQAAFEEQVRYDLERASR